MAYCSDIFNRNPHILIQCHAFLYRFPCYINDQILGVIAIAFWCLITAAYY